MDALPSENISGRQGKTLDNDTLVKDFSHDVEEATAKVETFKQRLREVEQYYLTAVKKQLNAHEGSSIQKDKGREKQTAKFIKRQQDTPHREATAVKRKQELMSQIGTILQQISQHKCAGPFMQPVDVVGLGLHDYFEVIEKPMDFGTIKAKMEAKDGTGYRNVREIYADVMLIFKNAMKYNDEHHDYHVMAKNLLSDFEEKWLQLLPKVDQEEKMQEEEEAAALLEMQLVEEAVYAKKARDLSIELDEFDLHLGKLRDTLIKKCRKISANEKKWLAESLSRLSPEDLDEAMLIVARCDPTFQADEEEVNLNLDAMRESTLWKLKFFVKEKQQASGDGAGNVAVVKKQKKVIQNLPGKSSQS